MAQKYNQPHNAGATRFSKSPMVEVEFSRMVSNPRCFTTYNAGDIVPIYCAEVLPHDTISMKLDFVNRLASAVIKPTMGTMQMDIFAFFAQNRVVNESWKNVQGENTSGFWTAPEVDLAPLYSGTDNVQIPVGSVADYYGFPTQLPIQAQHLNLMNDLKFRGYLEIYNNYFRDQNYQPPIPYSKLNVYNGFFDPKGSYINLSEKGPSSQNSFVTGSAEPDGSFPDGAFTKAVFGEGGDSLGNSVIAPRLTIFSALDRPLKANKLHDAFTSVLPSPQKGAEVYFGIGDSANVQFDTSANATAFPSENSLKFTAEFDSLLENEAVPLWGHKTSAATYQLGFDGLSSLDRPSSSGTSNIEVKGTNLIGLVDLSTATGISVNDLRTAVATQQVYETLARSGSRYLSTLRAFFEIEADSPFADIPVQLGHIRRELDLYQVAQTSASQEGNTAQGDLAAFGYTSNGGDLFTKTFLEHGYIHIFAVVRHRNVYSTMLAPDNFRKSTLDFYLPQFANIGEQPVRLATLNPFIADDENKVLGYQEAWWEYRTEPDRVSGEFRTGLQNGLDIWTYADPFDSQFTVVNGEWLKSNSQEVLDRTLAVTSAVANQFIGMFSFTVDKQRPMPTYSVPGLDTI